MSIADKITSIETHLENDYEGLENLGVTAEDRNIENIRTCLDELYNNIPKTTDTGTNLSLTTLKGKMNIIPKGDTSQDGTPTPSTPIDIEVVTGTQEVKVENVNLFEAKLQTTTDNGITVTNNNNGTFTINGTNSSSSLTTFRIDQSTQNGTDNLQNYEDGTYTLDLGIQNENIQITLMQVNTWQQFIATGMNVRLKSQAITGATNMFIYIAIKGNATLNNVVIKPMFVKGSYTTSTIPEFTPHQEQTQTISLGDIELCKIGNYQDYLYKSGDKWYKKEQIGKVVLNGSETWQYDSSNQRYYTPTLLAINVVTPPNNNTKAEALSNIGIITANETIYTSGKNGIAIHPNGSIYITKSVYDNISTTNVILYYVYLTPQDIEITDTTLIEQLNNLEKAQSYNGITNISSNGNLPIVLGVSALKGES